MDKTIDFNKTIYEIWKDYPEITEILYGLGFHEITKPGMLNTAGRFMTIPKGAAMKKIDLELIERTLSEKGYFVQK
jgi:Domain of unknown function (DUF1858).